MATAPINSPRPIEYIGNDTPITRAKAPAASGTAFKAFQFVKTPTALTKLSAGDTTVFGLSQEDAATSTTYPPDALYFQYTNVFDVRNTFFLVNITDGSGTIGSGSTTQADVAIGSSYPLIYGGAGSGTYANVQMLNAASNSNPFFKVEAFWPQDLTTTFNGRVLASVVAATIQ